jgi:hypothetical protein
MHSAGRLGDYHGRPGAPRLNPRDLQQDFIPDYHAWSLPWADKRAAPLETVVVKI